ncbi:MAG TPA: CoA transferase [Blastococcus sp.]|nr:CoA transferase [Blastococcus sp.]
MPTALQGIRVVDLSRTLPGALAAQVLAAQVLADFGADVVMVEPPGGSPCGPGRRSRAGRGDDAAWSPT